MKRLYSAVALCLALLVVEGVFMLDGASAKGDLAAAMLRLPAPPPPNPDVHRIVYRPPGANAHKPPSDDASPEDLMTFWTGESKDLRTLGYVPEMSDKTFEKLTAQVEKDPNKLTELLGAFKDEERAYEFVKKIYDREGTTGEFDREERQTIKEWLVYHSPYFSDELARRAQGTDDTDTYVAMQEELLQLTRFDFDRARPMIDQMYSRDSSKASRVLARWALYRHALDTGSFGDAERYRDELKAIVEDKSLSGPMRDLAMDALVTEKEWSGRDDWYYSLLGDETLHDLNGYTGLTTLINVSPPDKYIDKMLELVRTGNPTVRAAAIRNLILKLSNTDNPELIRAFIPWLEDPNWAKGAGDSRLAIVQALRTMKIPESVPGLIKMLDEKVSVTQPNYNGMANAAVAVNAVRTSPANANAAPRIAGVDGANTVPMVTSEVYRYRSDAISALGTQGDPQAGPPLRRMLNEAEVYERNGVVQALVKVRGFSLSEQVDAFESAVKRETDYTNAVNTVNSMSNAVNAYIPANTSAHPGPPSAIEIRQMLGNYLMYADDISDELAAAVVDRIETLDTRDPSLSEKLRKAILRWPNAAVNMLLMRDVKKDRADLDGATRLLGMRKMLRDKQSADVFDLRTGGPTAVAIAACILEDEADYNAILDGDSNETKTMLLACGRVTRAPLNVAKVATLVRNADKQLAYAAEMFLESEDSKEARNVVLSLHPGEAKITGATSAFFPDGEGVEYNAFLYLLFQAVDGQNDLVYNGWMADREEDLMSVEKRLRDEVKKDGELLGVYGYDRHYVRIYKDKVIYSWEEDESRYRERPMETAEFDQLKGYLSQNRVDDLLPYAQCGGPYCTSKELVMLSRNGGRRVYMSGEPPPFFVGLDKFFEEMKKRPATIKYTLSREIPGLELLMADDNLHAETVWKNGDDLRVAVRDETVRHHVDEEIENAVGTAGETASNTESDDERTPDEIETEVRNRLTERREFEGYSWRAVVGGAASGIAAQPPGVDFIPIRDGMPAQPTIKSWKARYGGIEIRAGDDGLYKIAGGRATKIKSGAYGQPLVTPNGRWIIVNKESTEENAEDGLVRIDLATGRETRLQKESYPQYEPFAYLASINSVLLDISTTYYNEYEGGMTSEPDDNVSYGSDPESLQLLNPDTGVMRDAPGEFRPLSQQTFRPLQKALTVGTFWAAMPDFERGSTDVGIYDTRNFTFRTVMTVPKIAFNSMSMWVDEPANTIYFVYRGHLLKLPLKR